MNWAIAEAAALMAGISLLSFGIGYLFGLNHPRRVLDLTKWDDGEVLPGWDEDEGIVATHLGTEFRLHDGDSKLVYRAPLDGPIRAGDHLTIPPFKVDLSKP